MREIVADLHLHSSFSDGLDSPESLCDKVLESGLQTFSLTDHDSVAGHDICSKCEGAEFIPGIELTATNEGKEVHILGYFIDSENEELLEVLGKIATKRKDRLFSIVKKLNASKKALIDWDELGENIGGSSYNRLNLARFMIKKGVVRNLDDCFSRLLGDSSDAYEAVDFFSPVEAIALLHGSGGVAYVAHPFATGVSTLIPSLVDEGLDGIEVYHSSHSPGDERKCMELAERYNLGICGGSDYHGNENSPRKILSAGLDKKEFENFLAHNRTGKPVIA